VLKQVGEQIAQVAKYLREGKGSREELASLLGIVSDLVGTTLPDMLVISSDPRVSRADLDAVRERLEPPDH
jgi:hypothetical protein